MRGLAALLSATLLACQPGAAPEAPDLGGDPGPDLASGAADSAGGLPDLGPAGGSLQPGTRTLTIKAGGVDRSVLLHVPAAVRTGPLPLVVALHGNGDTADNFLRALGLIGSADATPFVLAAPQGILRDLTIGMQMIRVSWDAYQGPGANIDLALLQALREQLLATGSIDPRRVLVLGYSQGGYMTLRYGLGAASDLSCLAVAAASNPLPGSRLIADAPRRIPVALQIGDRDGALRGAQATGDELKGFGHPVQYVEVPGAGHVPFPGDVMVPLRYCLER